MNVVLPMNSLLIWLATGAIAGILANFLVRRRRGELLGDIFVGILGAVIAGWLLPQFGLSFGHGWIRLVIHATIGAVLLLMFLQLIKSRL